MTALDARHGRQGGRVVAWRERGVIGPCWKAGCSGKVAWPASPPPVDDPVEVECYGGYTGTHRGLVYSWPVPS
jgi:hypothetical protein